MQDTGINGGWHRARAAALGAAAALVALVAAYAAWVGMLNELHRLEHRSTVHTPDALPVLLRSALVLALLWAALLVVLATVRLLRRPAGDGHDDCGDRQGGPWSGGLIGRVAAVLLAVTALSSLSTAAPAFAATTSPAAATVTAAAATTGVIQTADNVKRAAATADSCSEESVPTPGWVPDKPTRTDQVARDCAPLVTGKPVADDSGEVVVHRGDTLWSIAAAHLGPHADAQTIAAEWPHWYAANRDLIGDDPDLLQVGTRLLTPDHALEGSNR